MRILYGKALLFHFSYMLTVRFVSSCSLSVSYTHLDSAARDCFGLCCLIFIAVRHDFLLAAAYTAMPPDAALNQALNLLEIAFIGRLTVLKAACTALHPVSYTHLDVYKRQK